MPTFVFVSIDGRVREIERPSEKEALDYVRSCGGFNPNSVASVKFYYSKSDALFAREKMLKFGLEKVGRPPDTVRLESTNFCNSKCVFCPRACMTRPQGIMSMELYKKVVDECAALKVKRVQLHNFGEPLIDKLVPEKVAYAKQVGIPITVMITNGSLMTEDVSRQLIEAGLDKVEISLDAGGKEVYEATRVGLKYDVVERNVENLVKIRNSLGKKKPFVTLLFIYRGNLEELAKFNARWNGIADERIATNIHNWGTEDPHRVLGYYPCHRLWSSFTVLWDGRVALCCMDSDGKMILGDMNTQTIMEIWNNDRYQHIRKIHLQGVGPQMCMKCDLPVLDPVGWVGEFV